MADTLATLIVKLSADTAEMTTGMKQATQSAVCDDKDEMVLITYKEGRQDV